MWDFRPFSPGSFRAPIRKVTRVFLHCTDSDNPTLVGAGLAAEVDRWHKAKGWTGIGYHFVVDKEGVVATGRPLELQPAAQLGPDELGNVATIAISTHGAKHWTHEGLLATRHLVEEVDAAYRALGHPVEVWGHTEIDPRPCPVYEWRALHGLGPSRRFGELPLVDPDLIAHRDSAGDWPALPIVDPAPAPIGSSGVRVLFEGCHGLDVTALQLALGRDKVKLDGWFGRETYKAVVAFQKSHGLTPVDGIVGKVTRAALGLTH